MKPLFLALLIACFATAHGAQYEHREHGSHLHGHAQMNIAWSGHEVEIELLSPAMNLVGFEHAVSSEADHEAVEAAVARLRQPLALISPNRSADCTVERIEIESKLMSAHHDDEHEHEHGKEAHHDHDDEHDEYREEQHSDFTVHIGYHCDAPGNLGTIDARGLFDVFSGMQEIEVQWISDSRQSGAELKPSNTLIRLQ